MRRTRRNHAPGFKAKVALAAIKGDKTMSVAEANCLTSEITGLRGFLRSSGGLMG